MAKWNLDSLRSQTDDRVDIDYIIDRLDDILDDTNQKEVRVVRKVEELKRELIYNLGVNYRNKRSNVGKDAHHLISKEEDEKGWKKVKAHR